MTEHFDAISKPKRPTSTHLFSDGTGVYVSLKGATALIPGPDVYFYEQYPIDAYVSIASVANFVWARYPILGVPLYRGLNRGTSFSMFICWTERTIPILSLIEMRTLWYRPDDIRSDAFVHDYPPCGFVATEHPKKGKFTWWVQNGILTDAAPRAS